MKKTIAVLPGDGIGPEIMAEAVKVLDVVAAKYGHDFTYAYGQIGGAAWDEFGEHFPEETREICANSDSVLFGSTGGPISEQQTAKWLDCEKNTVLGLRKTFNFSVNYRPIIVYPELAGICPLRRDLIDDGVDILCVRELSGGIYFGDHSTEGKAGNRTAIDVMTYEESVIQHVSHSAFKAAELRGSKLTSVDKANVLDCSRLWREVVEGVAGQYPSVSWEHLLVDNCAMQVITRPADFDVLLMPNMFGDIISDELSVLSGSLGMLPSASFSPTGKAMYEPSGGSAPDIAGQNIANPIGQILSAGMMLLHSFYLKEEHDVIQSAVSTVIEEGIGTSDIQKTNPVTTSVMGDAIAERISSNCKEH